MREIAVNTFLFVVWLVLTAALLWGIYRVNDAAEFGISGSAAFGMWLVGQLVILTPIIRVIWRDRNVGQRS